MIIATDRDKQVPALFDVNMHRADALGAFYLYTVFYNMRKRHSLRQCLPIFIDGGSADAAFTGKIGLGDGNAIAG